MPDPDRLARAYERVRDDLLAERGAAGYWVGELAESALATATAVSALSVVVGAAPDVFADLRQRIDGGLAYLAEHQHTDGGWGDTDRSRSNIATTMLVRAAFHLAGAVQSHAAPLERAGQYVEGCGGVAGLRQRYGKDKTFAVPILTNAALAGLVDWKEVAPLPFELGWLSHRTLRLVRLPVVSYALPALVAIGQARFFHRPPRNPLVRLVRRLAVKPTLRTLERMQPASGGFLEATPLTAFVVMGLASTGRAGHAVVRRGVGFLTASVRPHGAWPIDTNLATWNTTLAAVGLDAADEPAERYVNVAWLLGCQHRHVHPFTQAAPGGWGWTDLSGAVPDADDTAGALLALAALHRRGAAGSQIEEAATMGVRWLLALQNRDGGWPTFCRGWGTLPFDRSGPDLSAHAVRALWAWRRGAETGAVERALRRALRYLERRQQDDGTWLPLWFGDEHRADEENPVYGTARVLLAYRDLGQLGLPAARRGLEYLVAAQNADGGFGGVSTVEQTAVAAEALLAADQEAACRTAADRAVAWLVEAVERGSHRRAAAIGFYFARLWYHERLYPLVFSVAALGAAALRNR